MTYLGDKESEETRFREAVKRSMLAVHAMSEHLVCRGWESIPTEVVIRPSFKERHFYGDDYDIRARKDIDSPWVKIEIKGRQFNFTNADDFPFPTVFVDRVKKADAKKAHYYINISADLKYGAAIKYSTKPHWIKRIVFDKQRGHDSYSYECPKEMATFFRLDSDKITMEDTRDYLNLLSGGE